MASVRRVSAEASGGTSADWIYAAIERVLAVRAAEGRVLDLGAGKGGLTLRLAGSERFSSVTAADLMPRPSGLPQAISWVCGDLNSPLALPGGSFDTVVASEVIEHLENPRAFLREIFRLLAPGGLCVVSTPNCDNLRSLISLAVRGHHWAFGPRSYPAHITPLCRIDLERCFGEVDLREITFHYTDRGGIPGRPRITWQRVSFGRLRGRLFADNVIVSGRRPVAERCVQRSGGNT
jgi:SAM-dependent methyltransferase